MSFAAWLSGETRSEFVARRVEAFRKDYQRTREFEGTKIDQAEFRHLTVEAKHEAEDSYDRWH